VSIVSAAELEALRQAGIIVRRVLDAMREHVRPGVSTAELDEVGAAVATAHGARSAPQDVYGFPGFTCISVNEEIVHGIPGARRIGPGDVVKLDVTLDLDGFVADAAQTVLVPPVAAEHERLEAASRAAFHRAMAVARAGQPIHAVGRAVEDEVRARGFVVIRELTGHGVGRTIHEQPVVPNYFDPRHDQPLTEGLVLTIEPIIAPGNGRTVKSRDGWTVLTEDGSCAAHFEHTLVITQGRPLIVTAP